MKEDIPFVGFYSKHGIIPTRQNISDLKRHIQRRSALYRQLGLPDSSFRGSRILEFGPGSGDNAIVTAIKHPKRYLLVDANPQSIHATCGKLREFCPDVSFSIKKSSIEAFRTKERFDIVLAEGLIPTQHNPSSFLRHLASCVDVNGVIVITTMDSVSLLPEMLRRCLAWRITRHLSDLDKQVHALVEFFSEDIASLPGMSRHPEDWVLDQMIHPWSGPLFSIPDAVDALGTGWSLMGSSPRFLCDWRWYKNIHGPQSGDNTFAISSYHENCHNLIDFRFVGKPLSPRDSKQLQRLCMKIYQKVFRQENLGRECNLNDLASDVSRIANTIDDSLPITSKALKDFCTGITRQKSPAKNLGSFRKLWGRGQQYMSFVRLK